MADPIGNLIKVVGIGERVARSVTSRMARDDLAEPLQRVLIYLGEHPGSTDRTIGRHLAIRSPHLSAIMKTMSERGWVQSVGSPSHQRQWLRSLTGEGEAQATRVNALRREAFVTAFRTLDDAERRALEIASLQLFRAPPSSPGEIQVVTETSLILMLRLATSLAKGLGWRSDGLIYVARRITIHFERMLSGYEAGWIINSGQSVVGVCLMTPGREFTDRTEDDGAATISLLHVHEKFRGQGHGLRLLDRCIEQARVRTCESLTMCVPADAKSLIRLLKHRKFKRRAVPGLVSPYSYFGKALFWVNMDLRLMP